MSDAAIRSLAARAGLAVNWTDAHGGRRTVLLDTLRAVLTALGFPCATPSEIRESRSRLQEESGGTVLAPLITADVGAPIRLPPLGGGKSMTYRLTREDGAESSGRVKNEDGKNLLLPAVETEGYYRLEIGSFETVVAVAPQRCWTVAEALGDEDARAWGLASQLYALRRDGDGGIGHFGALADLARQSATLGSAALAISPVHAMFSADPERFSPYGPSSRLFINVLHADPAGVFGPEAVAQAAAALGLEQTLRALEARDLIDWPGAARAKLAVLRRLFDSFRTDHEPLVAAFERFRSEGASALEDHARFEALHAHRFAADPAQWSWRSWPESLHDPRGDAVRAFAGVHATEVEFHAFLQWLATAGLAAAQETARGAGMPIGLIADLAVGSDPGGSQAWSRQSEMLIGLSVGAPPDLLNALGQGWGLTTYAPHGLAANGYRGFLEMLRTAFAHAGGVRIDHVMGLTRLWLIPDGAPPTAGAYLRYPIDDLLRLIALESRRHRGIVIGEDLGTVPRGFRGKLAARGIMGMSVLWFERDGAKGQRFRTSRRWSENGVAMTSTHDLPTVAGWWRGVDIGWREKLSLMGQGVDRAQEERARAADRQALWKALAADGLVEGEAPAADAPAQGLDRIGEAAAGFIGRAPAPLAILPLEDALGMAEQPNLPGTVTEHPNWSRRFAAPADVLLDDQRAARRLAALAEARKAQS